MDNVSVYLRIAGWAENALVILLGLALAGMACWLALNALKDVLERIARIEELRAKKAEKALEEWETTFHVEQSRRIVAEKRAEQEKQLRRQIAKGDLHASKETA